MNACRSDNESNLIPASQRSLEQTMYGSVGIKSLTQLCITDAKICMGYWEITWAGFSGHGFANMEVVDERLYPGAHGQASWAQPFPY